MTDLSKKLFLCYAWEDTARIQEIIKEIEHELKATICSDLASTYTTEITDSVYTKIEDSEIFVIFISDASKKSEYVKACATRASNLNKNVLPIEIDKQNIFSSTPDELKFRTKPYSYPDDVSKAKLFAQLKASMGFNVEGGDDFGALVHIVTDRDAHVYRYGENLGFAKSGADHKVRLVKGTHLLEFVDAGDSSLRITQTVSVASNDDEKFINVNLDGLFTRKKLEEEREQRQAEIQKKFEDDKFNRDLKQKQQERELELQRKEQELQRQKEHQEQELQRQRQQQEQELRRKQQQQDAELKRQKDNLFHQQQLAYQQSKKSDDNDGCGCSWIIWLIIFLFIILGGSML